MYIYGDCERWLCQPYIPCIVVVFDFVACRTIYIVDLESFSARNEMNEVWYHMNVMHSSRQTMAFFTEPV